jgi:hypothetical protein
MLSHKNDHLNANEDFCFYFYFFISLISKFITYFIDGFNSRMKYESNSYSLSESEHIYRILDLEVEVHSTWVLWTWWPSRMHGQLFSEIGRGGQHFSVGFIKVIWGYQKGLRIAGPCPYPIMEHLLKKLVGGAF